MSRRRKNSPASTNKFRARPRKKQIYLRLAAKNRAIILLYDNFPSKNCNYSVKNCCFYAKVHDFPAKNREFFEIILIFE